MPGNCFSGDSFCDSCHGLPSSLRPWLILHGLSRRSTYANAGAGNRSWSLVWVMTPPEKYLVYFVSTALMSVTIGLIFILLINLGVSYSVILRRRMKISLLTTPYWIKLDNPVLLYILNHPKLPNYQCLWNMPCFLFFVFLNQHPCIIPWEINKTA